MRSLLALIFCLSGCAHAFAQCADSEACNFNSELPSLATSASPCLTLETHTVHTTGALAGLTTYRLYVNLPETDQFLSAISTILTGCTDVTACNYSPTADFDNGSCDYSTCDGTGPTANEPSVPSIIRITTTTTFHQDALGSSTGTGVLNSLFSFFPDLMYDSWVTIGHAPEDGAPGATVSTIASPNQNWVANFEAGNDLIMDDLIGGLWYIYNDGNDQGVPDEDGKVLIAQLTTDGAIEAELTGQYFPDFGTGLNGEADGTNALLFQATLGTPCPSDPNAGCTYADAGLDCDGNCLTDQDSDGICDEEDPCVGTLDSCNVCNGPGAIYECGCNELPAGECDCQGNQLDALGICGGSCTADADADGICDDVDSCVGTLDACGVCNGEGAIYACGCSDIPAGDCDCNGNQLDAIGTCGGNCAEDADGDGICDDVDPCVGQYDALGECNGPCTADADNDGLCDDTDPCVGSYDALGICNGNCPADADGDGVCDNAEILGCTDPEACNFNALATEEDGSCSALDAIGSCGGSCETDADGDGVCDDVDPCVGNYDACGVCNGPGAIYDCGCSGVPAADCDCEGNQSDIIGVCGGSCTADADSDGICDDVDDCIGTLDACGVCDGVGAIFQCGCNNIPEGQCDCEGNTLDALGVCGGSCSADANGNGICDDLEYLLEVEGCMDGTACNYNSCANADDGSCQYTDALGVCGGSCTTDTDGDGVCDTEEVAGCTHPFACNYSASATNDDGSCLTTDAIGECGGTCTADADGDGICDQQDECVGSLDVCGVCNGPGAIYDCGCTDIPAEDCDCNGNQTDALGVCGGSCAADSDGDGICDTEEINGCTNPFSCNYVPGATDDDGSCLTTDAIGQCGGTCTSDADGDGICDDEDDCIGSLDACGICNGPGAIYDCGCAPIPAGDCDCDGNQPDALGVCGGTCSSDDNANGICDDVEVPGCTYAIATNYDPQALQDDGSCLFDIADPNDACSFDFNEDGGVGATDLLVFLGNFGTICN